MKVTLKIEVLNSNYSDDIDINTLRGQLKLLLSIAERHKFEPKRMDIMDIKVDAVIEVCRT